MSPCSFVDVIDVQRPRLVDREEIGDVDQRRDRPQPDRLEPPLQPLGTGPVGHAADRPAARRRGSPSPARRSTFGSGSKLPSIACISIRLVKYRPSPAAARSRAMPSTPMQSGRLGVTATSNTGIVEPGIIGEVRADRRVGGKLDDPVMLLAELQLADRAHHAVAFDAADRRDLQRHVAARDIGARRAEHADHARRGRWARRTPPAPGPSPASTRQHLQLVGLRMAARRVSTLAIVNGASASAGLSTPSTSSPMRGQRVGDLVRQTRRFRDGP